MIFPFAFVATSLSRKAGRETVFFFSSRLRRDKLIMLRTATLATNKFFIRNYYNPHFNNRLFQAFSNDGEQKFRTARKCYWQIASSDQRQVRIKNYLLMGKNNGVQAYRKCLENVLLRNI